LAVTTFTRLINKALPGRGARLMTFAAAGVAAALAAGTSVSLASTSATASSGIVHVYEIGGVGPTDQDVITGAFTDYGVDHTGALDHGMVNKVVLSKGSFEANVKKLFAKTKATVNPKTCSIVLTSTAPVQLSHGTRAYKGIRGSITVKLVDAMVMPRLKNGQCAPGESSAKPLAEVGLVTGSGRVSW
jgi:hypothetical protein